MTTTNASLASTLARYSSMPPRPATIRPSYAPLPGHVVLSLVPAPPVNTLPPAVRAKKMFKIVRQVASQMARRLPRHVDMEDLVAAGGLGLADAFSRRNGMPGSEFEAFASYRVRGAMLDELRRLDAMPRRTRAHARKVAVAMRTVEQRKGAAAGEEEVAKELGLDVSAYQALQGKLEAGRGPMPMRAPAGDEDDWGGEIADVKAELPDAIVARMEVGALVVEGIATLPERMRAVLVGVYVEGHTLKEIGAALGVSESRVCQIHGEALAIIRARLSEDAAPPPASCRRLRKGSAIQAQETVPARRRSGS